MEHEKKEKMLKALGFLKVEVEEEEDGDEIKEKEKVYVCDSLESINKVPRKVCASICSGVLIGFLYDLVLEF